MDGVDLYADDTVFLTREPRSPENGLYKVCADGRLKRVQAHDGGRVKVISRKAESK
jgi:hypothetical protein